LAFLRNLAYFCSELCRQIFDFLTAFDSHVGALTRLKISRKLNSWNSSNGGRNLGVGALLGFWALTPNLTIASYSTGDREKNGFCLGGIGPHLGEIWGFEIWQFLAFCRTLAYFCSELCRQIFGYLTAFDSHVGRLTIVEISRKLITWNSSNVGRKLGGGALLVHFGGLPPSGVRTPI